MPFPLLVDIAIFITLFDFTTDDVACSQYVFPVALDVEQGRGSFTCVPMYVTPPNGSVDSITWYKSNYTDGSNAVPVNETRVTFKEVDGVANAFVNFTSASISDAGYYFPVVGDVDPDNLTSVFPIIVACKSHR